MVSEQPAVQCHYKARLGSRLRRGARSVVHSGAEWAAPRGNAHESRFTIRTERQRQSVYSIRALLAVIFSGYDVDKLRPFQTLANS